MGDSPIERRQARRQIGDAGRHAERRTIRRVGGRGTVASGAVGPPADYHLEEFLVENKSTRHASLQLNLAHLLKIAWEAAKAGKAPAMTINFTDARGELVKDGAWVVLPEEVWRGLAEGRE